MSQVQHWGVTGWSTEWMSLEQDDDGLEDSASGFGFVRVVEPGVVYFKPPVAGAWTAWSDISAGRQRRFQMPWREDEQPAAATVLDLHARLAPRRAKLEPGDDQLRQLDESIAAAIGQVDRLHRAGGTLGFVQPDSVLFCRLRDGSLQVVFPDLGFAWDEARGLREPKWIAEPQLDCLFEEGARRQNAASLAAFRDAAQSNAAKPTGKNPGKDKISAALAAAQLADVRGLARLIAVALAGADEVSRWCGTGRSFLAMPGRDRAPDTQAPVWDQVVAPTLLGKVTSCADLLQRLEAARPSEHYLFKPPAPPPIWKVAARRALPGVAGLAALVGLLLVVKPVIEKWMQAPDPHPLCGMVYPSDPRFATLDQVEEARGEAQVGDLASVAKYWELLAAGDDLPEVCLGKLRREAAELIATQALALPGRLRDEPMPRREQVDLLQEAFQLASAADEAVPGSCQRVTGLMLRHLEARGEVPRPRQPRPPASKPTPPSPAADAAAEPAAEDADPAR